MSNTEEKTVPVEKVQEIVEANKSNVDLTSNLGEGSFSVCK